MIAVQRQPFPILLFIYLFFFSSRFCISQHSGNRNVGGNSIAGVPTLWINRPDYEYPHFTSILGGNGNPRFLFGFSCNIDSTNCFLGVIMIEELVWSANRNHPVETNATLELGQDGNLVLADSDGTLVWSTNTTGKSVSGLNLTEKGNLVLFDKANRTIWQSFDHPTDSLLSGQRLVSGRKLIASVSASNMSQGLLSLAILSRSLTTYIDSDPPQYYFASDLYLQISSYFRFDGQTITALRYPPGPTAQYMKLEPDGHLRVYQWDTTDWKEVEDSFSPYLRKCGYPMVCGRYSICTNAGQCTCPAEGNFFRPSNNRKPDLGCTELTSISCDSPQHHSLLELKNTTYFALDFNHLHWTSIMH